MSEEKKFKIFAAAYLLLLDGNKIFLSRRKNTGYNDGNYSLVSGHFEEGETAKQCIIRESMEEVGIKIDEEDLSVVHIMHRYRPERTYMDIYLKTSNWKDEIKNMEPDKCDDLNWFDLDKLPKNTVTEVEQAINNYRSGIFYSEYGW